MSLDQFLDRAGDTTSSLVVVNRNQPLPVQRMLEKLFDGQPVAVEESDVPGEDDAVLLVRDGEVVASSPLSAVMDAVLLVNSDLFITGSRDLADAELPAVLDELEDTRFDVRGYPENDTEKLLLIAVSRAIEREAWLADEGKVRSAFQRLSRMNDESGTRAVYETLADSDLDVHVYGIADWVPDSGFDVTAHAGYGDDFRKSWFVLHRLPGGGGSLLLAYQTAPTAWSGFWTSDESLVEDVAAYLRREL